MGKFANRRNLTQLMVEDKTDVDKVYDPSDSFYIVNV